MKVLAIKLLAILGFVLGVFLIARAVAELVLIDYGDSSSYRSDWGGPTIVGVLAVHVLPGLLAGVLMHRGWRRSSRVRTGRG